MSGESTAGELAERLRQAWADLKAQEVEGARAQQLYAENVWPLLLELWRREPCVEPYWERFVVSIHTLGHSPEATVLAILGLRATDIYVLHTADTRCHLEQVRRDTGRDVYPIEIGKSDVPEIYRAVERLVSKHPGKRIVVDLTSGTKAMTAGAGAAAFFLQQRVHPGLRVAYVDSDEYDPALRKPVPGAERLILLPNPHEVLGDLDEHVARELYAARKFGQAAQRFRELRDTTGQGGFGLYAKLCEGYRQWYALDFEGARSNLRRLLDELRQDAWLRHDLAAHRRALEVRGEGLEAVCQLLHAGDLSRADGVVWVCATLLHLGRECEGAQPGGQPVLAALYYYRTVELLLQHRLAVHGYDADQPNLPNSLLEAMRQNIACWLSKPVDRVEVSCSLGLLEIMALLRALDDPVVRDMTDAEIRGYQGILRARRAESGRRGETVAPPGIEGTREGAGTGRPGPARGPSPPALKCW